VPWFFTVVLTVKLESVPTLDGADSADTTRSGGASSLPGSDLDGGTPRLLRDPLLWISPLVSGALCAPFFRYVFWLGDEGVVVHGAERLLRGEALYRDFFEFLSPGNFLAVAAWMRLAGADFAACGCSPCASSPASAR